MELQRQSRQEHLNRLRANVPQQSSADLAAQRLREQQQRNSGASEPQAHAVAHPQSGSVRQQINKSTRQGRASSPQASSPSGATPRGRRTNRTQNFFADNADDALEHAVQNRHHDNATLRKLRQIREEKQGVAGVSGGSSAPVVAPPGGWAAASERRRPGRQFDPPLRRDKTRSPHEQQQLTNRIRGGQPDIIDDSRGELTKAQRHRLDQAEKDHEDDVAMAAARRASRSQAPHNTGQSSNSAGVTTMPSGHKFKNDPSELSPAELKKIHLIMVRAQSNKKLTKNEQEIYDFYKNKKIFKEKEKSNTQSAVIPVQKTVVKKRLTKKQHPEC
jgi:hypothetical protein